MEGLGFGYNSMIAGLVEMLSFLFLSTFLYDNRLCCQCITKKKRNCRILCDSPDYWTDFFDVMGQ